MKKILGIILLSSISFHVNANTVDEIIEITGGWSCMSGQLGCYEAVLADAKYQAKNLCVTFSYVKDADKMSCVKVWGPMLDCSQTFIFSCIKMI